MAWDEPAPTITADASIRRRDGFFIPVTTALSRFANGYPSDIPRDSFPADKSTESIALMMKPLPPIS